MRALFNRYHQSIALHLLLVIFGFYFLVAVLVTVVQLYKEYENTKTEFYEEIQTLPATFGKGISDSVWTYNQELLESILQGMYNLPIVVGVKIQSSDQKMDLQIGAVLDEQNQVKYYDSKGQPTEQKLFGLGSKSLFSHEFPIHYQGPAFNNDIYLGKVIIYSNDQLVFERVKYGFFLILINSLIKTFALWFIIYFFIKKYLGRPLEEFTHKIRQQNTQSPQPIDLSVHWTDKNELLILKDSYNQMIQRLKDHQHELLELNQALDEKVKARTHDLELAKESAERLAYSDPLTQLNNRRAFFDYGQRLLSLTLRQQNSLSLIMLDIDKFKKLNDTFGHALGDQALKALADTLKENLRSTDIIGRLGGEEFAVLLPNTGEVDAIKIAQNLREKISQIELKQGQSSIKFTASLGVVERTRADSNIDSLLAQADKALYASKNQGRNRVTSYSEIATSPTQ
ncbi:GGDEF domain-containing protein [Thiomicrorhabdus sediminis]|uniref:diguanylate cyclase n=1 Tax=Thiomicrorhabdus sediminis TaxID=2580412 RepID=A0A4P9K6S1_9GAMM|nr:sensor domain-containing diguanylate cyclase [Thiomicrorhabdus sediminis]QCU90571.1 diguanylate cyclase [Thiomicrorhabdus sediminis]